MKNFLNKYIVKSLAFLFAVLGFMFMSSCEEDDPYKVIRSLLLNTFDDIGE